MCALFDRFRKDAEGTAAEDFFKEFMSDERYRFARDVMEERPGCFEHVSVEQLAELENGGTLRGTQHDRKALLLWARDPEGFMKGGA